MKLKLISVGKEKNRFIKEGIFEYISRIKNYSKFEYIEVKEDKIDKHSNVELIKSSEEKRVLKKLLQNDIVVVLDSRGKQLNSVGFSNQIIKWQNSGKSNISFITGGTHGVSDFLRKKADIILSLSEMTFPHGLIRLIFLEQLYRAFTIINKEPYHK